MPLRVKPILVALLALSCACGPAGSAPPPQAGPSPRASEKNVWENGRRLLGQKDPAGANAELDRWLEYDPKYALVRADLGLLLFSGQRQARRDAELAAADRAEAEGSLLSAFRHMVVAYALTREEEGEAKLADDLIRLWKAASPRPGYPPGLKWHLARAQALAASRRHEEAAVAYVQAARFCPWSAEAHYNAAMILGEYQRYAQAVPSLKRALALLPEGPEAQEASGALFLWETLQ